MEDRYIATILLHSVGDTLGFKNGDWEFFTKKSYNEILEKLYEFIDLGGINDINLDGWLVSDDTILHMSIVESLLSKYSSSDELNNNTVKNIIKACESMIVDEQHERNRYMGVAVRKHYIKLKNGENWKKFAFDHMGGGNGSAMRCHCIGLAFFGSENRRKLIQYAIDSSRMTHVNPIGWLGGLSTAIFTAFAIEEVHINKWIPTLLDIIAGEQVKQNVDMENRDESKAYETFIQAWKTYYESRFVDGIPRKTKSHTNPIQRVIYYNSLFDSNSQQGDMALGSKFGMSGYSAVIVAYDCLIDAKDSWEKLVVYSILNNFDSDTIGAIACGLFGAIYGLSKVPRNNVIYIENKETIIKMGNKMFRKYYKHEKI